ncbi:dUTP diphosphatase [Bacillus sp. 2205SS5-2]|uniref:dUTP diphosphatase n=1 Tax=Bacillus sp. 2205SS5-2 TaxID=3109031 RepID=UPI0030053E5E
MNIQTLFNMQKELDSYIEENKGVADEDLFSRKLLALLVEIGELANETRCFKFWSNKSPSAKSMILEEFVDGVHFILSLGLEVGVENSSIQAHGKERDLTRQFLVVMEIAHKFGHSRSKKDFQDFIDQYFYLGRLIGFSEEEIVQAYYQKNEVNYRRQQEGY